MKKYDNSFTDELRNRLPLYDVISRRVSLSKKGQNYWGCCPFHNEKTPSFSVSEEKGYYHCFGCGAHGDIISFVMQTENMDFKSAIAKLAEMAGIKLPEIKPKSKQQQDFEESYIKITDDAAKIYQDLLYSPIGQTALEYIKNRGFNDDMIKKYRIGYAPKNNIISSKFSDIKRDKVLATGLVKVGDFGCYDFFRDKLMFPIFNTRNQIVAFSGRSLDGSEPKYINTSDTELFHKRQTIFGFNFAREYIHRNNRSIIVEGQIDAIQMQNNGFPETVAPLGTALTEDHIYLLCKSNRNIVFCFDGDNAGQKAAMRACNIILPFFTDTSDVKFAFITGGKDPDEILKKHGQEVMQKIIDSAKPLVDFLWESVNKNYLISTPAGRTQAEKFLQNCIKNIPDNLLQKEIEKDYNNRKFNQWHKWKLNKEKISCETDIPSIDDMEIKTLKGIINTYQELGEKYIDFLSNLNISFDNNISTNLDIKSAEKFIKSLKIKTYIKELENQKQQLLLNIFDNKNTDVINDINLKIIEAKKDLENLIYK